MSTGLADKLEDVDAQQRAGAAVEPRQKTVRDLVQEMEPQFRRALPAHIDAARFTRLALTALRTTPKLAECSPESVLAGLMQAAQLGLEIDAFRGQAFLIPRWNSRTRRNEASFQVGYKGLIDLAGRGGITIRARKVCENDLFEFEDGLEPKLRHVPELKKSRGEAWAYFAVATFSDDRAPEFCVMSRSEVEAHRDRFASARSKKGDIFGPWVDDFDSMALKTVDIKLLNGLPLPVELADALSMEAVPLDVTDHEPALPPAAPESADDRSGASGGTPPPAANEHGGTDQEPAPPDVPPAEATTDTKPNPLPDADADDPDQRELAKYMLDEARKANPDDVKAWLEEQGMPNDSRRWTRAQISAVIDWIHAEPEAPKAETEEPTQ